MNPHDEAQGASSGVAGRDVVAEHDDAVHEHASPLVRGLLLTAGTLCVALGMLGIFLPLLPTTPFLLLAAACYARASRRFYNLLLSNRTFGPLILEWRRHRAIPYRTKISAIVLMSVTLAVSIVFFVKPLALQVALALLGVGLAIWMYRLPSRDRALQKQARRRPSR
ncbi:MAG TPA: YbaN family protein [Burkholderiaceae bacterium]|nr:YbaN family protein [Burkholderiaceae bacterium]